MKLIYNADQVQSEDLIGFKKIILGSYNKGHDRV